MILTENGETSSSKADDVLESVSNSSPIAPPSYVARNTYATNDKTPAFGDESGHPPSSMSSSFYASAPLSAIAGPLDLRRSEQDSEGLSIFSRVPPRELSYSSFQPIYLLCKGKSLDKGFPPAPPPSSIQPHPFNSHDITEGDWLRFVIIRLLFENRIDIGYLSSFVEAVYSAAQLTEKDIRRSDLPLVSIIPIISTYFFLPNFGHIPTPWIQIVLALQLYRKS